MKTYTKFLIIMSLFLCFFSKGQGIDINKDKRVILTSCPDGYQKDFQTGLCLLEGSAVAGQIKEIGLWMQEKLNFLAPDKSWKVKLKVEANQAKVESLMFVWKKEF